MNTKSVVAGGVAAGVLLGGSILGGTVLATVSAQDSAVTTEDSQTAPHVAIFQRVAELLGISEDELSTAVKTASTEHIDEKVADGTLDADKAEEMKERIAESEYGMPFGGGRHGMRGPKLDMMADFLGVTEEELQTKIDEGTSPHDLIEEYGKTHEEFHDYMEENRPEGFEGRGPRGNQSTEADESATI